MPPKKKGNVGKGKKKVTKKNESEEEIEEESVSQEQSLYDILEKKNFSPSLFKKKGEPMVFYIAPCDQKKQISNLIVKGGGLVQRFAKEGIITLVETKSDLPERIPKECYSINYITDSIQANKLVEIARYRVTLNKKAAKRDSFSPRKRILFTKEDDEKLVEFVNKHGEYTPSGSRLWQLAEKKLDGGHTWQSMRSRYLKVVRKLNFNSDDEGEDDEDDLEENHEEDHQDHSDHSQSKKKRKNDRSDENGHVKKKSKKDETDEGESSDDLKESSKKANLKAEDSFIEAEYLDNKNNNDEEEEEEMNDEILTQEVSKPRTKIHSKNESNKKNKKNINNNNNKNDNEENVENEEDEKLREKSYVKEIVLSVINNLMLTTKLPRSVVVHGLIVNNGVVSDTIQYLHNPQEFYDSRSKSAQIWTYTEDKILLDKHERGLEDLAHARGSKSIQYRQLFLES